MLTRKNKSQGFNGVSQTGAVSTHSGMKSRGFSLIELLIVMAVMLIVAAIATPTIATTMDAYRLRGSLTSISGLAQRCRLLALKKNTTSHMYVTTSNGFVTMYCKDISDSNQALLVTDPQIQLTTQFSIPGLPNGGPTQLTAATMWGSSGSTFNTDQDPYFNSRGLPCNAVNVGTACKNVTGYLYYIKYTSTGRSRWAAMSISPASRIESWFWNGSSWGN